LDVLWVLDWRCCWRICCGRLDRSLWLAVRVFVGGAVPIGIALSAAALLPESIRFLLLKGGQENRVAAYLARISRDSARYAELVAGADEHASHGFTVKQLFKEGRALVTPLLWICFF